MDETTKKEMLDAGVKPEHLGDPIASARGLDAADTGKTRDDIEDELIRELDQFGSTETVIDGGDFTDEGDTDAGLPDLDSF